MPTSKRISKSSIEQEIYKTFGWLKNKNDKNFTKFFTQFDDNFLIDKDYRSIKIFQFRSLKTKYTPNETNEFHLYYHLETNEIAYLKSKCPCNIAA